MYYNEHDQADAVYYVPANTCAAVTGECVTGYQSFSGAVGAIMCACSDAVQMRALGTQRVWRVQLTSTVHRRSQVSRVSRVSDAPMGRFHSMHHSYEQDTPRFRVFGALECTRDCECDCCQNRCRHQPQSAASRPCWHNPALHTMAAFERVMLCSAEPAGRRLVSLLWRNVPARVTHSYQVQMPLFVDALFAQFHAKQHLMHSDVMLQDAIHSYSDIRTQQC